MEEVVVEGLLLEADIFSFSKSIFIATIYIVFKKIVQCVMVLWSAYKLNIGIPVSEECENVQESRKSMRAGCNTVR